MIPEDDQIFTEVELNTLEKIINETMVSDEFCFVSFFVYFLCVVPNLKTIL